MSNFSDRVVIKVHTNAIDKINDEIHDIRYEIKEKLRVLLLFEYEMDGLKTKIEKVNKDIDNLEKKIKDLEIKKEEHEDIINEKKKFHWDVVELLENRKKENHWDVVELLENKKKENHLDVVGLLENKKKEKEKDYNNNIEKLKENKEIINDRDKYIGVDDSTANGILVK